METMPFLPRAKQISWTHHAEAKMAFYRLSKQRALRVVHAPKRTEEGIAPKTVAVMQPVSIKKDKTGQKEIWSQEIWVMFQDAPRDRTIISVWRYPGMTKQRNAASLELMRREYQEFIGENK